MLKLLLMGKVIFIHKFFFYLFHEIKTIAAWSKAFGNTVILCWGKRIQDLCACNMRKISHSIVCLIFRISIKIIREECSIELYSTCRLFTENTYIICNKIFENRFNSKIHIISWPLEKWRKHVSWNMPHFPRFLVEVFVQ